MSSPWYETSARACWSTVSRRLPCSDGLGHTSETKKLDPEDWVTAETRRITAGWKWSVWVGGNWNGSGEVKNRHGARAAAMRVVRRILDIKARKVFGGDNALDT